MKKIISACMCLLLVAALAITVFAAGSVSFSASADKTTLKRGDTVTLSVSVSSTDSAKGYGFKLAGYESVFELVGGTPEKVGLLQSYKDGGLAVQFEEATAYSGSMGTITLKVKDDAPIGKITVVGRASVTGNDEVSVNGTTITLSVVCTEHVPGAAATCTTDQTCTECGTVLEAAKGHSYGAVTYTGDGMTSYAASRECSCGDEQTATATITSAITNATCTENGKTVYTADFSVDWATDKVTEVAIIAQGHIAGAAATCVKDQVCTVCNAVLVKAKGHTFANWTDVNGKDVHIGTCSNGCGETVEENHIWQVTNTVSATCSKDGKVDSKCAKCAATKTDIVKATGAHVYTNWTKVDDNNHKGTCGCGATSTVAHKWDAGKVTTEATCTKDGVKTFTCSDCKSTKTEVIKANGEHVYTNWTKVDDNNHKGTCGCGATSTVAHKWDAGKVTTDATCGKDGVKTFACSVCKGTKTEVIKATGEHDNTASYKDNADGTHSALCDCGEAIIEKHDYSVEGMITVKPSTSNAGKQDMLCVCGAKTVKTLPQLPADLDDVPKTGDISIQVTLTVATMISMAAAAAYVFKRKIAK